MPATLLHHLISATAERTPAAIALGAGADSMEMDYQHLAKAVDACAGGLVNNLGLPRGGRVAIWLDKRFETVIACFGAAAAGGAFVPVNPVLKPAQLIHILRDSGALVLITSPERLATLKDTLHTCPDLGHVVLTPSPADEAPGAALPVSLTEWANFLHPVASTVLHRVIDTDMAAILYTSGSTGRPKGVVLSHRNMVCGAHSVAQYLENKADDILLAALPLSFDAGFSQLTTAFAVGAKVALLNYLLPRDVLKAVEREQVTGLTAVPPLWIQLAQLQWPPSITLRYFATTGGRMPLATLTRLRAALPRSKPYLMYGLTEAFRATCLPPEEVDRRPDSIGKAIPNAEVLVLRPDGSECAPDEPGELVQRGALVAQGYWNDAEKTSAHFRPLPVGVGGRKHGLTLPEIAVYSGDTVRRDGEGFIYFIGRDDEMIKTSGYRVSPVEVEEILYATGMIGECAAFGLAHDTLGHSITVIVTPPPQGTVDLAALKAECRARMPAYMVPARVELHPGPLPRNPNGKIDRKTLARETQP
ncbi:acyl-CoA ligase (AMP-forming), exosortase A system-associated [Betaproteobacteria bacterium]|nr:acyl-CoA ligase (AMP-forming), exosortase A system-associated [Betaproteobacteria bacterium]GHU18030.1 acyl-CoA ligase (AMP-forming), exosortase A system-associated [Betaproteobacteria bacterium]